MGNAFTLQGMCEDEFEYALQKSVYFHFEGTMRIHMGVASESIRYLLHVQNASYWIHSCKVCWLSL